MKINDVIDKMQLTDLQVTNKVVINKEPELTEEKINAAIELLKEVEINNGHIKIAQRVGLTQQQVALIHQKMQEKIADLTKVEENDRA
jgi:hypothetical protein